MAGNIGAEGVQAAAKTVETGIKEGSDQEAALSDLEHLLETLIAGMPVMTDPSAAHGADAVRTSGNELIPLFDQLQALLEENDADAVDVLEMLASRIEDDAVRNRTKAIGEHLDDYEFDEALELLSALRDTIGPQ